MRFWSVCASSVYGSILSRAYPGSEFVVDFSQMEKVGAK